MDDVLRRIQSKLQQQRIRFHLKRVELRLRRADTSHLNEAQQVARQHSLAALREYRERGVFPINTDYPNECLPHLKDRYGTYCAVAHLVCVSGEQALVDELSEQDNLIRMKEVDDGPLLDWLRENGITRREAAAIQPAYGHSLNFQLFIFLYAGAWLIAVVTLDRLLDLIGLVRSKYRVARNLCLCVTSLLVAAPVAAFMLMTLEWLFQ